MSHINFLDINSDIQQDLLDCFIKVDNIYIASKLTSEAQVKFIKSLGVTTAIDLKQVGEVTFEDKKSLESEGIEHLSFPISDIQSLTLEQLTQFKEMLEQDTSVKLVYCVSGNRVGALLSLHAHFNCGLSKEDSFKFGTKAGMTREGMQEKVREMIFNGIK